MSWKYFEYDDFKCKCGCGTNHMRYTFIDLLDEIRTAIGRPMIITSGYRCEEYDHKFGGKGNHTTGLAADIHTPDGSMRFKLIEQSMVHKKTIKRIGLARTFTHLDAIDEGKPLRVAWLYY